MRSRSQRVTTRPERATCPGNENTLAAARRALAKSLGDTGIDTPELDARMLMQHALGLDHAALAAASERPLSPEETRALAALAERRLRREPLAYIVGEKEFWSLPLRVSAATLIPRPETETVVEVALAAIDARSARERRLRIADLGVGSGAILLALLSELPRAIGIGVDRNPDAIAVARGNAIRLDLADRTAFCVGDFSMCLGGAFDLVVSNPPYVTRAEIVTLEPEVRDHEPALALNGGADGLDAYRAIAGDSPRLVSAGAIVVEIGYGQERAVTDIFARAGFVPFLPTRADLNGVPRALAFGPNRAEIEL